MDTRGPSGEGQGWGFYLEAVYSQIIAELSRPERKVLQFLEGSSLPGYLLALTSEESERPAANFPPVAALGYAAAEMVLHQPAPNAGSARPNVKKDWNPYKR